MAYPARRAPNVKSAPMQRIGQNGQNQIARHILGHEGLPDTARQNETQAAIDHLLVLPHQRQKRLGPRQIARNIRQIELHAHGFQMRPHPAAVR